MSWKIWSDITLILSWFETDDVFTRLEILFEIACLLGYVILGKKEIRRLLTEQVLDQYDICLL